MRKRIRAAIRARLVRVVDEVVSAHRRELQDALAKLATHQREPQASLAAYQPACETLLTAHRREVQAALTAEVERVLKAVHDVEFRSRRDLWAAGERQAAASSARFAREVMPMAAVFDDPIATIDAFAEANALATDHYPGAEHAERFIHAAQRAQQAWRAAVDTSGDSEHSRSIPLSMFSSITGSHP